MNSRYYNILTILSLVAAIAYAIMVFIFKISDEQIISAPNFPLFFIIAIGGIPLVFQIIKKAFKGDLGSDLLAVIALVTAVYLREFLAADLIVLMLASGQALEEYASKKASFALAALAKRMPNIAHKKEQNKISDIDLNEIKIGDLIVIYPFETAPVDGVVVEGHGSMDESYLTGEPYRLSKAPGSQVLSGAINGENLIVIKAEKLAVDSRYAKIMQVMHDAESKKPNIRRLGDQIGAIFAPLALAYAFLTLYFTSDVGRFLSVLVVATPCPLLIAIPIVIISAISVSAKNGIIIKDPSVLEQLPICKTAIFDKTGTLTAGEPELTEIITLYESKQETILQIVASLEQYSRHPLAFAINKFAREKNIQIIDVKDVSEKPGQGLVGHINSQEILITSRNKISKSDNQNLKSQLMSLPQNNSGLECVVVVDKQIAALIVFHDKPLISGKEFINHLGPVHSFEKVMLVSGDRQSEVEYLANLFGIKNIYASQTPEQKLEIVRSETKLAPTMFLGDGINDAPALATATVGLAFGKQNIVASESAKAVILENSLAKVDQLIHISIDSRKIALQSAIGGMFFSFYGMMLASFGYLTPVQGAILQEIIDIVAILNALRLIWKKDFGADIKDVH